ncbi:MULTISPECIES: hypothetical protein [unclassified Mycolicibacterium]|uniref:hypothetical protein n=1 Tax=unclassified Mycolicibacterium TaxID=2636767 RepID=UPI0012DD9FCD|nr:MULTISPECIES: hypothetical protein [unclassified Mycolicibacterium]MUL80239.1 hypothetical protein [Mycolicibacterium sp. CBMA 329]MUL86006.1 hypothetical protein [Mycolicibacterium sp. CBMA 331]MUM00780.1 hypothetical protein [Mycolicibacterium sp. CBMA 334]MUM28203.1 hypothetical protein [Mycolicibacterium sp. CBMA 295]MUM36302.1 hypothetical protein [Mycolicibacterium sp. CBMA 247]
MTEPVDHIHRIIERHRPARGACNCGVEGSPDHSRHLAEEIARGLGLTRERLDETGEELQQKSRYVSAWFDDELTKLEGAE